MSWICPHDDKGQCARRQTPCEPGQDGCVLDGRLAPSPQLAPKASSAAQDDGGMSRELRDKTIDAMKAVFGSDSRRIGHALKVLDFAEEILGNEPGNRKVVVAAAVLHDIGIRQAEAKYGSSAGKYQEIEGPPIARSIMEALGFEDAVIDHVCRIIANHHSARDIDTPEFRVLWDADWLVNIPEEFSQASRSRLEEIFDRMFRTAAGLNLARSLYLGHAAY